MTKDEQLPDTPVLDACCGAKMFHFDKEAENVTFMDNRILQDILCDGRALEVKPDIVGDFRSMPFNDEQFSVIIFDPPHLCNVGESSWMAKKYGSLGKNWREDIAGGFSECFRVLKPDGVLVFKWSEVQIPVSQILTLTPQRPLVGHKSGKQQNTHWILFIK